MCIHHITHHTPCGHSTQKINEIVKCYPVTAALDFYHKQPKLASQYGLGRCFTLEPMRMPENCGACYAHNLRTLAFFGRSRSIKPEGWLPAMTKLARLSIRNGEDVQTTIIVLETEFPNMADKISEAWIHHLRNCFHAHGLTWDPQTDLQNAHLAGDIIVVSDQRGCGRFSTGDPRCFNKWENPHGGKLYCPWIKVQDAGTTLALSPDNVSNGPLPGQNEDEKLFEERVCHEMEWQWRTFRWEGPAPGLPTPPDDDEQAVSPSQAPPLCRGSGDNDYRWPPESSNRAGSLTPPPERRASMPGQDAMSPIQASFAGEVHDDADEADGTKDHKDGDTELATSSVSDAPPHEHVRRHCIDAHTEVQEDGGERHAHGAVQGRGVCGLL
ncbi:MAG: hypothetical protein Q9208_004984 [Pyrenodesmia sp. 3 TL-2023]